VCVCVRERERDRERERVWKRLVVDFFKYNVNVFINCYPICYG